MTAVEVAAAEFENSILTKSRDLDLQPCLAWLAGDKISKTAIS
jgi:hypothetical protein